MFSSNELLFISHVSKKEEYIFHDIFQQFTHTQLFGLLSILARQKVWYLESRARVEHSVGYRSSGQ